VKIFINNNSIVLTGFPVDFIRQLDERVSYYVTGYYFSPQYRKGKWDGKIRLLKHNRKLGYVLPAGLFSILEKLIQEAGITPQYFDRQFHPKRTLDIKWNGPEMRDYQIGAVCAIYKDRDRQTGKLMLKMPVRSGKTMTAAYAIYKLGSKGIFLVNSDLLFKQTINLFQGVLGGVRVGMIGDGMCEPGDVTVATMQTLMKMKADELNQVQDGVGIMFVDEVHHLKTAERWRDVVSGFESFYRIGLSATVDVNPKKENSKGAIWLRASTGPICYEIFMSDLMEAGHLVQPVIYFVDVGAERIKGKWSTGVYKKAVVENERRNEVVIQMANKCAEAGLRTLVQTTQVKHMNVLAKQMKCEVVYGKVRSNKRQEIIKRFRAGDTLILVGTVFGEAVDIPECEVVINAEGGVDDISTLQRLRNLTPSPGKAGALVIEFADFHNTYMAKHAAARLKTYKAEGAFRIKVMKDIDSFDPAVAIKGEL
jgi:superfamily II DNA or RNA helicase